MERSSPGRAGLTIRRANGADIERLDECFPEPDSRHRHRRRLQDGGQGVYLVAWAGADPAGWVFVHRPGASEISPRAGLLGAAELIDLQVVKRHRGAGIGRALMDAAERLALDEGWTALGLAVTVANPNNDVARAMYARRGYVDSGLDEFEDGYVYWDAAGLPQWDGETHRYLVKRLGRG